MFHVVKDTKSIFKLEQTKSNPNLSFQVQEELAMEWGCYAGLSPQANPATTEKLRRDLAS